MNLRTLAICAFFGLTITACKKREPEMVFDINGIPAEIDIRYTEAQIISLNAVHISGMKDDLTLDAEGLPQGAAITFKPNVQKPPFDCKIYLNTENVKGGDYKVKIKATPSHGKMRSFEMPLRIAGIEEIGCAMEISGQLSGPPLPAIKMSRPTIAPSSIKNQVTFTNCEPAFFANMDCDNHKLDIPRQKLQSGDFVSGTGNWTTREVNLKLDIEYAAGGKKNYTFILKKPTTLE